jgi:hypothetical protein
VTEIIEPGVGVLFMKVGTHAQETLEQIIARKTKEIEDAGLAMWGYGGNTCHPRTIVQPFANMFEQRGQTILLCMEEMNSKHFAQPVRADQYSVDGREWEDIHPAINVLGSRYALLIKNLRQERLALPLARSKVAVGNSKGRPGSQYISGRVDKACLEITDDGDMTMEIDIPLVHIGLVAELVNPYAVFLRNHP